MRGLKKSYATGTGPPPPVPVPAPVPVAASATAPRPIGIAPATRARARAPGRPIPMRGHRRGAGARVSLSTPVHRIFRSVRHPHDAYRYNRGPRSGRRAAPHSTGQAVLTSVVPYTDHHRPGAVLTRRPMPRPPHQKRLHSRYLVRKLIGKLSWTLVLHGKLSRVHFARRGVDQRRIAQSGARPG